MFRNAVVPGGGGGGGGISCHLGGGGGGGVRWTEFVSTDDAVFHAVRQCLFYMCRTEMLS